MRSAFATLVRVLLTCVLWSGCGGDDEALAPDASIPDGGVADAPVDAAADGSPDAAGPRRLSETGLYADLATKTIASDLIPFSPAYPLWSDGADKRRWLRLPPGQKIDTSDMDHWQFPVGTQVFKEFSRDGKLLETRLLERTGPGPDDWWMGAFVWLEDESDAVYAQYGMPNVRGSAHDVPSTAQCRLCHGGEPGRVLGFSAIQLPADLLARDLYSTPPNAGGYPVPGAGTPAQAAFGYLHANCGSCHNPNGVAYRDVDMVLRLSVAETTPDTTQIHLTTVGVNLQYFGSGFQKRVVAGDPSQSALYYRMTQRGSSVQMPPFSTEVPDTAGGLPAIEAWILSL